jgi:hypothetical protein
MIQASHLIFVYNAVSGVGNLVLDVAHKLLRPSTYDCNLCALTFGTFRENGKWKEFRKGLQDQGHTLAFLHKDEFLKAYASKFGHKFEFPIILVSGPAGFEVLLDAQRLNRMQTPEALVEELGRVLAP